jgi:PAS domain S-box-containing protein
MGAQMKAKSKIPSGARQTASLSITGKERHLAEKDIIVSKTNVQGIITYVNDIFCNISDYREAEMLGAPHSAIRHPHMPRVIFKTLWDYIKAEKEIFAYVMNRCKNGDHYWVLAHVTPCYDMNSKLIGYHSNRRAPRKEALAVIRPLYETLLKIEQQSGRKDGLEAAEKFLNEMIETKKTTYEEFVLSI